MDELKEKINRAFNKSIELQMDYFGGGKHRGYHPNTRTRQTVTTKELNKWFHCWAYERLMELWPVDKKKKTTAQWSTPELYVDCPYCNEFNGIALTSIDDWHEWFGDICESRKNIDFPHTCYKCGQEMIIDEAVY